MQAHVKVFLVLGPFHLQSQANNYIGDMASGDMASGDMASGDELDGDAECNTRLDFEEFFAMQPRRVRELHKPEDIKRWYEAADLDNDGDREFLCNSNPGTCSKLAA